MLEWKSGLITDRCRSLGHGGKALLISKSLSFSTFKYEHFATSPVVESMFVRSISRKESLVKLLKISLTANFIPNVRIVSSSKLANVRMLAEYKENRLINFI